MDRCPMCREMIRADEDTTPLHTPEGRQDAHRICMLREVTGGIGHLIAHEYWCEEMDDPDAGMTRYQSAQMVDLYVALVGCENLASEGL